MKDDLDAQLPRVAERPFDSDRKRMTTVHALPEGAVLPGDLQVLQRGEGSHVAITKGAVDGLLGIANRVWIDGHAEPLTAAQRERIEAANAELAGNGMRVLGVAFRYLTWDPRTADQTVEEKDLILVGLAGMIDPPRPEARQAVATCKTAGIRPVMITGDHPLTAVTIARELGIASDEQVLTGTDLNRASDEQLQGWVGNVSVFARVSPEDKLRIVQALQRQGEIAAMTGDGVNDSPALKRADR